MKSLQVVLVAGFIFSLLQIGTCQCDGEKYCMMEIMRDSKNVHLSVVRLAAAVHETLSSFTTEMREGLAAVKENMTSVQEEIHSLADYILELAHTYECGGTGGWRRVFVCGKTVCSFIITQNSYKQLSYRKA